MMIDSIYVGAMRIPAMALSVRWLGLEVKQLDRAVSFYRRYLDLPVRSDSETAVVLGAGDTDIVLRRPTGVPRGGVHTHFAFSTPAAEYDDWFERLSEQFDLTEFDFGGSKSLYFYDPDGNCVEIGQSTSVEGEGITGVFEIVLEVESLERAEALYTALGFSVVDRGTDRRRTRLTTGEFDIELWEPQLGLADARGGLHVDFGVDTDDRSPEELLDRIDSVAIERLDDGVRLTDPDGHRLTLVSTL